MALSRRRFLLSAGAAGLASAGLLKYSGHPAAALPASQAAPLHAVRRSAVALGTDVSILVMHADQQLAQRAVDSAVAELHTVEEVMSLYRPDSQLCRLNRDGVLDRPHPCLLEVLRVAQQMAQATSGAFDVTVQPLWQLYAQARQAGGLPPQIQIDGSRALVNFRQLQVDEQRIWLQRRGMAVTLNGIAQGFASDRIVASLQRHGVEHALVNTGEIGALGGKPETQSWRVGIQHPRQPDAFIALADLRGRCLATSGDYATTFSADYLHHHVFDPQTGTSPQHFCSVSVVAHSATEADALSTAVFVLGLERGLKLIEAHPGADMLWVCKDGSLAATAGFPQAQA